MNGQNRYGEPVSRRPSTPLPAPLRDALDQARALLEEASRRFPGGATPPFDPVRYAEILGIPVASSSQMPHWDALLIPGSGGFRILYSSAVRSVGRKRFSIAHEIAHTFFPDADATIRRRAKREDYETAEEIELERWCDRVAAELLMPESAFRSSMEDLGSSSGRLPLVDAALVPALADRFQVSLSASAVRYVEMSEEPCAVAFFDWMHRPSVEKVPAGPRRQVMERRKYRVREIYRNDEFPRTFAVGKSVPDSSIVYRCSLGREGTVAEERFEESRGSSHVLRVSAFPMHRSARIDEPPRVCAVFRL